MCYMQEITHRQLRNESGEVLRRVANGETILVTNNGQPAAVIGPPIGDHLAHLAARGELRAATEDPSSLVAIERRTSPTPTSEIVADVRGRW